MSNNYDPTDGEQGGLPASWAASRRDTQARKSVEAGKLLAAVLGDGMTASMVGGHFTCGEAENIAHALIALGQPDAAATFLAGHAEGDDDPDDDSDHLAIFRADNPTAAARDYLNID